MKKKLFILILLFISIFAIRVNAEEEESNEQVTLNNFEYYNITVKLHDKDNRYTVVHEFKATDIVGENKFYLSDRGIYNRKVKANFNFEYDDDKTVSFSIETGVDLKIEYEAANDSYNNFYYLSGFRSSANNESNLIDKFTFILEESNRKGFSFEKIGEEYRKDFIEDGNRYIYKSNESIIAIPNIEVRIPESIISCDYNFFGINIDSTLVWFIFTAINVLLCTLLLVISRKIKNNKIWILEGIYLSVCSLFMIIDFEMGVESTLFPLILIAFFIPFFYAIFFRERLFHSSEKIPEKVKKAANDTQRSILNTVQFIDKLGMWFGRLFLVVFVIIFFGVMGSVNSNVPVSVSLIVIILNIFVAAIFYNFIDKPEEDDGVPIRDE